MILNYHFGKNLEKYLVIKKITAVSLSEKMGVSHQAIANYLKAKSPREATLNKILKALGVSFEDFNRVVLEENVNTEDDYKTKYEAALTRENELLREIAELRKEKINTLEAERIEGGLPHK